MGPLKQLKRMFEPTRLIATIVMLVTTFTVNIIVFFFYFFSIFEKYLFYDLFICIFYSVYIITLQPHK